AAAVAEDQQRAAVAEGVGDLPADVMGGGGDLGGGAGDPPEVVLDLLGNRRVHGLAMLAWRPFHRPFRAASGTMNPLRNTGPRGDAMELARSRDAFATARELFVGGVNSPVRAYGAVGGTPVFAAEGRGAELTD